VGKLFGKILGHPSVVMFSRSTVSLCAYTSSFIFASSSSKILIEFLNYRSSSEIIPLLAESTSFIVISLPGTEVIKLLGFVRLSAIFKDFRV
jgi:hypothetical protein